jgi:hypothetical protein|tara:strand:- start:634 stop:789 length:156 start_codon:yes stop_codon:yes gene_type:complete
MEIGKDKLKRIEQILSKSDFSTVDEFVDRAIELLLFAEENKEKFGKFLPQD